MEVYDKISWQLDGGIVKENAIAHFEFIYKWLYVNGLLSDLGKELYETGVDESFSLSDNDLNTEGRAFIKNCYDKYISKIEYGVKEDVKLLSDMYSEWKKLYNR